MGNGNTDARVAEIMQQRVRLLNATVGKPYETLFDVRKLNWPDVSTFELEGLEATGLQYDATTKQITGVPTTSGDHQFFFNFKLDGEDKDKPFYKKPLVLIINPDPKSLWKTIESDRQHTDWKEDDFTVVSHLADRRILVSSKRGRAHANIGSFREDDVAFAEVAQGWHAVVVSDGAGSAKRSAKGSALACQGILDHFRDSTTAESMKPLDELIPQYAADANDATHRKIQRLIYDNLGQAAFRVHKQLDEFAKGENIALKDLNATLIFALLKKYDQGYAVLSFGVGDCPIALLNKDVSAVTMMNWLDVGEFGGGTRFITMQDIFQSEKFATRFGFRLVDDFSFLMLMSDGIYDPKFVVESNLTKVAKWQEFLEDLGGRNEDAIKVDFRGSDEEITENFSRWMDFWSPGNHDDRTLAIIF